MGPAAARFGLKGVAVSLVTTDEIKHVQEAERRGARKPKPRKDESCQVMEHYQCKVQEIDYDWEEFQDVKGYIKESMLFKAAQTRQ